ncbi:MAG: IS3 family transposase [Thermomicrobiales bacterium]
MADVRRTTMRYRSQARDQSPLRQRIRELAAVRVRYGYRRIHILLRREGWKVNAKRVYRLYREEGLSLRLKRSKKRVSVPQVAPPPATRPNERWSIDFLKDSLADGRAFRVFTIVDNLSRASPVIVADFSIKGERVVAVLDRLKARVGLPKRLAADNGPEFISKTLDAWAYRNGVTLEFSPPGKPTDNAFVESFNGHFRAECLDQHWFRVAGGGAANHRGMADGVQPSCPTRRCSMGRRPTLWLRGSRPKRRGLTYQVDHFRVQVTVMKRGKV